MRALISCGVYFLPSIGPVAPGGLMCGLPARRGVSASRLSFCRMRALISCGVYFLPSIGSVAHVVPMWRLTERMVRSTLVTAWFLADWPTRTSPFLAKATTEGVVREPSLLAMTVGSPPPRTVAAELVVPRSIPTARAMEVAPLPCACRCCAGPRGRRGTCSRLARSPLNFPAHLNGTYAGGVPRDPHPHPRDVLHSAVGRRRARPHRPVPDLALRCPTSRCGARPRPAGTDAATPG